MHGEVKPFVNRTHTPREADEGLPHDHDTERIVVGSVMAYQGDGWEDLDRIAPAAAYAHTGWGRVWTVVGELRSKDQPCSAADVLGYFMRGEGLPAGVDAMALLNSSASPMLAELLPRYARKVAEFHARRQAIMGAMAVIEMARSPAVEIVDLARTWDQQGEALRLQGGQAREWVSIGDLAADVLDTARDRAEGRWVGTVTTGYDQLDGKLGGGLVPGDLVIVGARPGMGKTAFAMSMMLKSARKGNAWGMFSLELMANIAARRLLAQQARVPSGLLKTGRYPDGSPMDVSHFRAATGGVEDLSRLPLWLCDKPAQSLAAIRSGIRRLKSETGKLSAVVVDYVQIMDFGGGRTSTADKIAVTVQGLRNVAKEEGVAVVALSQLRREVDNREAGKPMLSDLRDSGGIEAAATVVLFPWRETAKSGQLNRPASEKAEILIAKATDGETGSVPFTWYGAYQEFCEAEMRYDASGEGRYGDF